MSVTLRSRVEDFLDDKFQVPHDLESIDRLLARLEEQQDLLRTQLGEARDEQAKAQQILEDETRSLKDRAIKHEKEQNEITTRIQKLTESNVSDHAIEKFEVPMQKLRRIELAEEYIRTIQDAQAYEVTATKEVESNPEQAVEAYQHIRDLASGVQDAQPAAEGAAPHLVDQLSQMSLAVNRNIKNSLEMELKKSLAGMQWPSKELRLTGQPIKDWSRYTELLLKLQEPESHVGNDGSSNAVNETRILLPLSVMVQPLEQRFKYHYYGDRPTNRLDHPEYYFRHTLDLITDLSSFMSDYFQPILDSRIHSNDSLDLVYTDAISSLITALLPMVKAKCLSVLPQLKTQPQLMSHFVRESMSFDRDLKDTWAYSPIPGPFSEWKGLTSDILTQHGYFDSWLRLEKDFALSRYQKIVDHADSREIDHEGVEAGRTKPTRGAIRVNDLLETVTDRYRDLSSFSQKMTFLMDIQLSIFDRYHGLLNEYFQAYKSGAHTAGRMISGQAADDALGLPGLSTLVKIFGSAEYLERKMMDWSDDVFFLELWAELQDRASQHTTGTGSIGHNLNVDQVAAKTSSSLRNTDEIFESDSGALFDETASAYRRLREQSELELIRLFQINARNSIRALQNVSIWASLSRTEADISNLTPSSALDSFNQTITPLLEMVGKTLAAGPLKRIVKQICHTLSDELYDRLLLKHTFSGPGVNQLQRDVMAICQTIDVSSRLKGEAERHIGKLQDAIKLLSLPIRGTTGSADADEDGWGFDEEDAQGSEQLEVDEKALGLWQAERAIFQDNVSARKVLEALDLTDISEADARNIIRRRVEVSS